MIIKGYFIIIAITVLLQVVQSLGNNDQGIIRYISIIGSLIVESVSNWIYIVFLLLISEMYPSEIRTRMIVGIIIVSKIALSSYLEIRLAVLKVTDIHVYMECALFTTIGLFVVSRISEKYEENVDRKKIIEK